MCHHDREEITEWRELYEIEDDEVPDGLLAEEDGEPEEREPATPPADD